MSWTCECGTEYYDNECCTELREKIAALEAENAELNVHLTMLVSLDEQKREIEKTIGRHLVEARGKVGGTE